MRCLRSQRSDRSDRSERSNKSYSLIVPSSMGQEREGDLAAPTWSHFSFSIFLIRIASFLPRGVLHYYKGIRTAPGFVLVITNKTNTDNHIASPVFQKAKVGPGVRT